MNNYINLSLENIDQEHLCCAIGDKKHQNGVNSKKEWLKERIKEGHVFRKLDAKGKVFIEYAPCEQAWVPINGKNYLYIYCLWVSGSFSGQGYAKELLNYAIDDAKKQNKSGLCVLSAKKKKPFLSEPNFFKKFGFKIVDEIDDYQLLALSFDNTLPHFNNSVKKMAIEEKKLTIYYGLQCPYILNCIEQIEDYCQKNNEPLNLIKIDSLEKAKDVPGVFNNWMVFYNGKYQTNCLLNANSLKKLLEKNK